MRLTLAMIVKDEERALPRALAAARAAVDEIVVVDTGSRDRTLEVARDFGARTARIEWRDDFAQARNASIELASGDWILVLDADEELAVDDARARMLAFAASGEATAGRVRIENQTERGASHVMVTRFFRRDGAHRYRGRIHEQLERSGREPARADLAITVLHHGYRGDVLAARGKLARNRRLLELALHDDPRDGYLWFQLARTEELERRHEQALAALEKALELCPDDAAWGCEALEGAGRSLRALGRSREALTWLEPASAELERRSDGCFLLALLALDSGELERAESGFRRCLEWSPRANGAESSLGTRASAAHNLGVMREVLGRHDQAIEMYSRALELDPAHDASRAGLARLRG